MTVESLFSSETPVLTDVNEGVPATVANAIHFAVPGNVIGFRVYAPVTVGSGSYAGALWEITADDVPSGSGTGTALGTATFSSLSPGWNSVFLGTPVHVDDVKSYKVGLKTSEGRYTATAGGWSAGLTNGNIIGYQDGATAIGLGALNNGSFTGGLVNYPTQTFGSNKYFIDVLFVADAAPATPTSGANYELEQVMDALAETFNGVETGEDIGGVAITIECHPEVIGQVQPPSIVLELDDLDWDLNMGAGADAWTVVALALVTYQDMEGAQRTLWRFLSRNNTTSGVVRLKAALEADQTLGGLVSYAVMTKVRNIGVITYNGVDYLGAELIIEVVS